MNAYRRQTLKVAIAADFQRQFAVGGVERFIIGLLRALAETSNDNEHYYVILNEDDPHWIEPYLGANQSTVVRATPKPGSPAEQCHHHTWPERYISDGFYEALGCDVIHFAYQNYVVCAVPTVYTPHDLQHLHYPQFFKPVEIAYRETVQPTGCHFAQAITATSNWIKNDIVRQYGVCQDKISVIPVAPVTATFAEPTEQQCQDVLRKYQLEMGYAYYPAVTWPHKNHLRLLQCIAWLRDTRGLKISLVCSGEKTEHFAKVASLIEDLNLTDQVTFLDRVPAEDVRPLYRCARFVVVPTLHEAASFPIFEAWEEGVPVVCSNVTSLPEQAGNAGVIFDPFDIEQMGQKIAMIHQDEKLRQRLMARGRRRLQKFSWQQTAQSYRALYRKVAFGETIKSAGGRTWLNTAIWMRQAGVLS